MRKYYQRRLPEDPSQDYYYIMRDTKNVTPLLIEYGFIDNDKDVIKLQNNLIDYVEAVVKAVTNYIGVPYVSPGGTIENQYVVQKGDSLYSIANKFGTTVAILKDLNNLTSDILQVGQTLILPTGGEVTPDITYEVQKGDSLWSIANKFGITVDDLIRLNNLSSTILQIGQLLIISNSTENTPTLPPVQEPTYINYTVKSGDSLWSIANRYNTTVDTLKNINNLTTNILQIGQVLKVPSDETNQPPVQEPTYINYTVKSGDSLWSIANRYNTTVNTIKNLNNLTNNILQIGQSLKIPTTTTYFTYIVKSGDTFFMGNNEYYKIFSSIYAIIKYRSDYCA